MFKLTINSAAKLRKILSVKLGQVLTEPELEVAYDNLMRYTVLLTDLKPKMTPYSGQLGLRDLVKNMTLQLYST